MPISHADLAMGRTTSPAQQHDTIDEVEDEDEDLIDDRPILTSLSPPSMSATSDRTLIINRLKRAIRAPRTTSTMPAVSHGARSVLHTGDFTEESLSPSNVPLHASPSPVSSLLPPSNPSLVPSPPSPPSTLSLQPRGSLCIKPQGTSRTSPRASSLSSSFAFRPPTSPLVHSESAFDSTFMPIERPNNAYPYQAHQPRRSLSSTLDITGSPTYPVVTRSRKPSMSDSALLQHSSLVGSYEESLLRGTMSTSPSKPVEFLAHISVAGFGKTIAREHGRVKREVVCPPHLTLDFPAVYYSYGSTSSTANASSDNGPSPYVGEIDLENHFSNKTYKEKHLRHAKRRGHANNAGNVVVVSDKLAETPSTTLERRLSLRNKNDYFSQRPKGQGYEIPKKGTIQILIQRPDKAAVKAFLIPYNLKGMKTNTKTFIRQRTYAMVPQTSADSAVGSGTKPDKRTLQYLVHLQICCPGLGKFFIYKSIRVVFVNRAGDGRESILKEIQRPEPLYIAYNTISKRSNEAAEEATPVDPLASYEAELGDNILSSPPSYIPTNPSDIHGWRRYSADEEDDDDTARGAVIDVAATLNAMELPADTNQSRSCDGGQGSNADQSQDNEPIESLSRSQILLLTNAPPYSRVQSRSLLTQGLKAVAQQSSASK